MADDAPTPIKGTRHLSPDEKLALVRRVEAGESQTAIGREFGISRQAVFIMVQGAQRALSEGRPVGKIGRAIQHPLDAQQLAQLRAIVTTQTPAEAKIPGVHLGWTGKAARALVKRLFGRGSQAAQLHDHLRTWGVFKSDYIPMDLYPEMSPELKAYLESDIGKEVIRREQEWIAKEKERFELEGPQKKKLGRPRKEPLPAPPDGDHEDDNISLEDMERSIKEMQKTMGKQKIDAVKARYEAPGPGKRSGKHALNKRGPKVQPKKKRR
jgi:transposase-like protein